MTGKEGDAMKSPTIAQQSERIVIIPKSFPSKHVDVRLETNSIVSNNNDKNVNSVHISAWNSPMDSLLLSILDKFGLDSLSLSISDSSDQSVSHTSLHEMKALDSEKDFRESAPWNFPVGTALQFTPSLSNGIDYDIDTENLLRVLMTEGVLCENAPVHGLTGSKNNLYTNFYQHASKKNPDDTMGRVIILPNHAYALCHTSTMYKAIALSHPCSSHLGIFSNFQFEHLISEQEIISKKAIWIDIRRSSSSGGGDEVVTIQRGLRYTQNFNVQTTASSVSLEQIMGKKDNKEVGDFVLEHCPIMMSSKIITLSSSKDGIAKDIYDFKDKPLDMRLGIIQFPDIINHGQTHSQLEQETNMFGIERTILRPKGLSNSGTFLTRVYYKGNHINNFDEGGFCQSDPSENSLNVTIIDMYPKVAKPILHSLKLVLKNEGGFENEDQNYSKLSSVTSSRDILSTLTELTLEDIPQHRFSLSSDGSAMLSITTTIPNGSSLYITMDYLPRFHPFERFPMDPNRGVDIPPSYMAFLPNLSCTSSEFTGFTQPIQVYSNALLLMPPVPDLSMPFNAIGFTNTFYAFLIGSTLNVLLRKGTQKMSDDFKGVKTKRPIDKLKDRIKQIITRLVGQKGTGKNSEGKNMDDKKEKDQKPPPH